MYVYILFIDASLFYKNYSLNKKTLVLVFGIILILSGVFLYFFPVQRRILFGIYVIGSIFIFITTIKKKKITYTKFFYKALLFFAFAYSIWILDFYKIFCNPLSLYQGHSIWHIMNSIVIGFIYFFLKKNLNIIRDNNKA